MEAAESVREGGKQNFFMFFKLGQKTVHISQRLAGSHSSWQGVMFHSVLQNEKKKKKVRHPVSHLAHSRNLNLPTSNEKCNM